MKTEIRDGKIQVIVVNDDGEEQIAWLTLKQIQDAFFGNPIEDVSLEKGKP